MAVSYLEEGHTRQVGHTQRQKGFKTTIFYGFLPDKTPVLVLHGKNWFS